MNLRKSDENDTELQAPKIFIPYPQTLDPKEFLPKLQNRKPCNGFMIYRKVYQKQLNASSYRFKMTVISRWASALWLKENEKLKDAYRQFASKIARIHSENHQAELEALDNRIRTINLLTAPYFFESQQLVSPPLTPPLMSDSISSFSPQYYYLNQSFPYSNLYLDNQLCTSSNNVYDDQQAGNHFENVEKFQTLPCLIQQPLENLFNDSFDY